MKKRIACGAAAILLTGLSAAMFSAAASHSRENAIEATTTSAGSFKADAVLVDRGRYLVRTSGCNDCHTPGYAEGAGNVAEASWLTGSPLGWQGPWGTTYPINVRLFMHTLSAEQWLVVARQPSRPPMPWFALRDMTDADLLAIYHYVRSLGPAGEHAPAYVPPGGTSATPVVKFPS